MTVYMYPSEDRLWDVDGTPWKRNGEVWFIEGQSDYYTLSHVLSQHGPLTSERPKRVWQVGDDVITEEDYQDVRVQHPQAVVELYTDPQIALARGDGWWRPPTGPLWDDADMADEGMARILRLRWCANP